MPKFVVIGHRGNGMNVLQSSDRRMRAIKENTIMSFNAASTFPLDFIEFDVQVTASFLFLLLHSIKFFFFSFSRLLLFRFCPGGVSVNILPCSAFLTRLLLFLCRNGTDGLLV